MVKWTDEIIVLELEKLIRSIGEFPSMNKLKQMKKFALRSAILRNGGIVKYRNMTGNCLSCKPRFFWNQKTAELEFSTIVKNLGYCPSPKELSEINSGLCDFLYRSGLFDDLKEKFDYKQKIKSSGFWKNWNNVKDCLLSDFGDLIAAGIFPTRAMIVKSENCRSAIDAMIKYHGGTKNVANRLNCVTKNNLIAPDGHFVDSTYELIFDWYLWSHNIEHEVHGYISKDHKYRYDFKVGNVYFEIWGLKNKKYIEKRLKKEEVYKSLGLNLISLELDLFEQRFEKIENSLNEICGFLIVDKNKRIYDIENLVKNSGYWTIENTTKELKNIIVKLGRFPSVSDLRSMGMNKILKPIYKHGGINHFRNKLGYPITGHPAGYWSDNTILNKLSGIIEKIGRFPVTSEIKKHDSKLLDAIFRNGGLSKYKCNFDDLNKVSEKAIF